MPLDGTARKSPTLARDIPSIDPLATEARDAFTEMAETIQSLRHRVDAHFGTAARVMHGTRGHVILTGIGKSGLIGRKIAATLASTGTPSFFVHAGEALHGDLGMFTAADTAILVSCSGETKEVLALLPRLRQLGVRTIALVGRVGSTLAREVDVALDVSVEREVGPIGMAPTSSTLATLAMGDALAIACMRLRGFQAEDFAALHPGGSLGKKLAKVRDAMATDRVPVLDPDAPTQDAVLRLMNEGVSVVLVLDGDRLLGAFGPEEARRALPQLEAPLRQTMNPAPAVVRADVLLSEVRQRMSREALDTLVVVDGADHVCGVLTRASVEAASPARTPAAEKDDPTETGPRAALASRRG